MVSNSTPQIYNSALTTIPLIPNTKTPAVSGWETAKPGDFSRTGHDGIVLSETDLVIDVDPRNYPDGRNVFNELRSSLSLPKSRCVRTPSGGFHIYYKKPKEYKVRKKQLEWPGIDFLSKGCQVVSPGSRINESEYSLIYDMEPVPFPKDALHRLEQAAQPCIKPVSEESLVMLESFREECQLTSPAIQGQNGNDTTYKLACRGRDLGLPRETVLKSMLGHWNVRCLPPWSEDELGNIVAHAFRYAKNSQGCSSPEAKFAEFAKTTEEYKSEDSVTNKSSAKNGKRAMEALAACASGFELWHDESGKSYATVNGDVVEHYAVPSEEFELLLTHNYFKNTGKPPSSQHIKEALRSFEAKARFTGPGYKAGLRVAEENQRIYIDLGTGKVVEIDAQGWRIISNAPVRFIKTAGMMALPEPEIAGPEIFGELRKLLFNFENDSSWTLFLSALIAFLRPGRPSPVVVLSGPQGSAKSTGTRIVRSLVDPTQFADRSPPKNNEDLMIAAKNNYICSWDNLSHLPASLSDSLCRLSTGGSIGSRRFHTNDQEVVWRVIRGVVINGIEEIATRQDLLERSLIINMNEIKDEERKTEDWFWTKFEELRPKLLGALYTAASGALRRLPDMTFEKLPRMADFFTWVSAACVDLGINQKVFESAFSLNKTNGAEIALESSIVAQYILKLPLQSETLELINSKGQQNLCLKLPWEGTAQELLDSIKITEVDRRLLPRTPKTLSDHLKRLEPALKQVGIQVTRDRTGQRRKIRIENTIRWRDLV
ncbi:MAG: bifunctional DNA primase/polymerase [Candidatus Melainabacteria bacterium]|nr:bifunctional DNA primase/polymerase [Candidatus Melainabacteria bacterium]